jgi:hypothetical protein
MAEFPDADLQGVTELRIHGVSGTPVTDMLEHPHPVQVSGDAQAGFYRRGSADDPELPERRPERRLEAYSWGGLTAGASARAFWLLLLPFTLVNVASWSHPVRPRPRFAPVGWMSGLVRLIALTVTGTITLGVAHLSLDVVAWQCGGDDTRCASHHFFTRFMTKGYWSEPGHRLVVGAAVPILLVAVLWWLSRSTGHAYEEYAEHVPDDAPPPEPPPSVAATSPATPPGGAAPDSASGSTSCGAADFARPRFWKGGRPLRRLRSLHTGAALAAVAGVVAYAVRHEAGDDRRAAGTVLVAAALVVVALASLLAVLPYSGRRRELFEHRDPPALARIAMDAVQYLGAIVMVAALVYAWTWSGAARPGILPGLHHAINRLLRWQMILWVALVVCTVWALVPYRRTARESLSGRPMFWGFAEPVLAALGVVVAGTYVSGIGFRVADYLGTPVPSSCLPGCGVDQTKAVLGVPPEYYWAGTAFAVAAAAALATGVGVFLRTRKAAKRRRALVRTEYAVPAGQDERVATIAKAEAKAKLTDSGDIVLLGVLAPALVGTFLLWVFQDHIDGHFLSALTTSGTWLVGAFAVAIVGLGRSAYRNDRLRRTVGIIWDLATFWPRAAHPFAPPCYCERTVPELRRRVSRLRAAGGRIVLSAHSQGTVIAAATALQIPPGDRDCVGLVTYGSPLDRLYARAFPHYFGAESLADIDRALGGRWRNLYRHTDPIGGPVFSTVVSPTGQDRLFVDPAFAKDSYEFSWPRTRAHSGYPHDPRFEQTITEVAADVESSCAGPPAASPTPAPARRGGGAAGRAPRRSP